MPDRRVGSQARRYGPSPNARRTPMVAAPETRAPDVPICARRAWQAVALLIAGYAARLSLGASAHGAAE